MNVAICVFVTVKADQVRKFRRADWHSELSTEGRVRSGFLNRDSDRMVFAQRLGVAELRKPGRYGARRAFKLQSIWKCIGVGESAPRLSSQKVFVLSIELP